MAEKERTRTPAKGHTLPHGTGSFYYRAKDSRWVGTIEAGWNDKGKRRRITVTDRNENAAWQKLTAKRKQILDEGIPAEGVGGKASVESWCKERLQRRQHELKPKPFVSERAVISKWIIPTLGHRKLAELTPGDVRKLGDAVTTATYRGKPLTATYANKVQSIFFEYMTAASVEGHPVPQRIFRTKRVSKSTNDRAALPLDAILTVLMQAHQKPDHSRWDAAFLQAIRQGEALGLTEEFVDFENHTITIWWELQELTKQEDGSYYVPSKYEALQLVDRFWLLEPKSKNSRRTIPMIPEFEAALKEWMKIRPMNEYGLIWPRANGMPRVESSDRTEFKRLQEAAGVCKDEGPPIRYYTPHEARHSTIAILLELGIPRHVIEAIVGHVKLVENYVSVSDKAVRSALQEVGKVLQLGA